MKYIQLFILVFCVNYSYAENIYEFSDKKQNAQFQHLLKNLRCPVCQNQDLSDSNAGLAKDLRQEIYTLINEGNSDDDIINYLTDRYGDFILFQPKFKLLTVFLWIGPIIFIIIGFLIFYFSVKRPRHA
jgi:cytochrome c-type biogenesis protein CcmH